MPALLTTHWKSINKTGNNEYVLHAKIFYYSGILVIVVADLNQWLDSLIIKVCVAVRIRSFISYPGFRNAKDVIFFLEGVDSFSAAPSNFQYFKALSS